jgi:hypothetical protein
MRSSALGVAILLACLPPLLLACNETTIGTSNNPPGVVIQQPVDGSTHSATEPLELRGVTTDTGAGGGIEQIAWTSSISGVLFEGQPDDDLGNTLYVWDEPEAGAHEITLRATDNGGATTRETIEVTIVDNGGPDCTITSPTGEKVLDSTAPILLQGQVDDDNTPLVDLEILWESDLDGVLDETPADDLGVTSVLVAVSAANHELSLTVTDDAGLTCSDSVYVTTNGAPSAPGLSFDPNPPSIAADLSVVVSTPSVDPEGAEVEYFFRWFVDEVPWTIPPDDPQDVIPAAALARDQVWLVEAYAADDLGVQSEITELETIVPDSPPGPPGVTVTPAAPTQAQNLLCEVSTESVDPDPGDLVDYSFDWLRDGSPTALSGPLLGWEETLVGEAWTCRVTPTDSTLVGADGEATVTVQAGCSSFEGNGVSSQAIVPDDAALRLGSGAFTVEAWVKLDALPALDTDSAVVSKRDTGSSNGWYLAVNSNGRPFLHVSVGANPKLTATASISTTDWHHLAVVYDSGSGQATWFIDGVPSGSGVLPQPSSATTADLYIGNDSAGFADKVWDGLIDDVRLSSVPRYGITFIPDTQLAGDADTIALWGFEEGAGTDVADLSLNGQDGAMAGGAFSMTSTCDLDLAPTASVIELGPDYPDAGDALSCTLLVPSVDPEGNSISYAGEWLVDGVPSGNAFTSFPASLPGSQTADGEEWTCQVVASDGAQSSVPVSESVFVGSFELCTLQVTDPSSAGSSACGFEAPIAGMLRFTASNPDASADGRFVVDMGTLGTSYLFTGFTDWAYDGETIVPWAEAQMELNVSPSLGPLTLTLQYDPSSGTDNTGPDELIVDFVYYDQLSTTGATLIGENTVSSAESSNSSVTATNVTATVGAGERLLLEAGPCGSAGLGAHGIYAGNDLVAGNDGLVRVDTGEPETCAIPLRSLTIAPDAWDFSLVNEDDFWTDNSGARGLALYRYTP